MFKSPRPLLPKLEVHRTAQERERDVAHASSLASGQASFNFFDLELEMAPRITLIRLQIATSMWSPTSASAARATVHLLRPRASCSVPCRGRICSLPARRGFGVATQPHAIPRCSSGHGLSISANATSTVDASDLKDTVDLSEFVLNGGKVTSVAHGVWRKVVRPGDTVIDATCGNGHHTLELTRLVCAENAPGYVYAFDVQEDALTNSSYLLDQRLDSVQRKRVKLLRLCHSQLEKIVGETAIRLVTFNLGYLPGGDHTVVTNVDTTIQALQASSNVLQSGGLISVVAYVGHSGGREEFEAVMNFAANLPSHAWICSQHEWVNRPLSPRLILMLKR